MPRLVHAKSVAESTEAGRTDSSLPVISIVVVLLILEQDFWSVKSNCIDLRM